MKKIHVIYKNHVVLQNAYSVYPFCLLKTKANPPPTISHIHELKISVTISHLLQIHGKENIYVCVLYDMLLAADCKGFWTIYGNLRQYSTSGTHLFGEVETNGMLI